MEKKILVVDDESAVCSLLRDLLVKKGYNVVTALSGEEALEAFKKERPILTLLDIRLPGMDGIITLERIREMDKDACVIMLTGLEDEESIKKAKRLGADGYITKPLVSEYFEKIILEKISLLAFRKKIKRSTKKKKLTDC